jgi:hypothetical protein
MSYTPRTPLEIMQQITANIVNRGDLNDISPGGALHTIIAAVSKELAHVERRISGVRQSYFLDLAVGVDLDERCAELGPGGITRIRNSNASGSSLFITRDDATDDLLIPAGSTVSRSDNGITYYTLQDVIIPSGDFEIDEVFVVCSQAGTAGNCSANKIDTIGTMPVSVVSVFNSKPLNGGLAIESDDSLRERAKLYLQSLSRTTKSALEYLGRTYKSTDGTVFKFASIYEDLSNLGYSELVVDDGTGLSISSVSKNGRVTSGTVPVGGKTILYHESPAIAPINSTNLFVYRNGQQQIIGNGLITSIPERGIVYIKEGILQPGDTWQIKNYKVFTGAISELQNQVEGNTTEPSLITGFRAAGTRVRVVPTTSIMLRFDIKYLIRSNTNVKVVEAQIVDIISNYISTLLPGQELFASTLIQIVKDAGLVTDIQFFERNSEEPLKSKEPGSARKALRLDSDSIKFIP